MGMPLLPAHTGVAFVRLLRSARINPETRVIMRALFRYWNRVASAAALRSVEMAVSTYDKARALPSTATEKELRTVEGLSLHDPLWPDSEITIASRGLRMYVLKPLDELETARARAFLAAAPDASIPHVSPFELLTTTHEKRFMLMPRYLDTIQQFPPLEAGDAELLWEQLSAALSGIHALGFAHMDVKPSNICISEPRSFCLVDLGSIAAFGERTASTSAYVPADLLTRDMPASRLRAAAVIDWWMLAMTLAEKGCGAGHALDVGGAKAWRRAEVREHLERFLPHRIWAELAPRLMLEGEQQEQ